LWSGYAFDGFGTRVGELAYRSKLFRTIAGADQTSLSSWLNPLPLPIPPQMVRGIDAQLSDFDGGKHSYMRGVIRRPGWTYYYLYGLMVKLTIGGLILIILGIVYTCLTIKATPPLDSLALLLPIIAIMGVASFASTFTNHVRYVLPCVPFLILAAGRFIVRLSDGRRRTWKYLAFALIASSAVSAAKSYPNWLGYFNEIAGGPSNGWWHLEDSNVDWGQDLIHLAEWMDDHPEFRPIALVSHHCIDPGVYLRNRLTERSGAEYVAVSAYRLQHEEQALWKCKLVDRVGTSFFIFELPK
jgi:hypothetical protein